MSSLEDAPRLEEYREAVKHKVAVDAPYWDLVDLINQSDLDSQEKADLWMRARAQVDAQHAQTRFGIRRPFISLPGRRAAPEPVPPNALRALARQQQRASA